MLPFAFAYANFGFGAGFFGVSVMMTHGGNAVIMLIDMVLSRQRLYYYRVIWAVGFMSSYMAFSYVYSMNGGTYEDGKSPYVYSWLDWKNNYDQAIGLSMWLGIACPAMVYISFAMYSHALDLLIWAEGQFLSVDVLFHSHAENDVTLESVILHARGTSSKPSEEAVGQATILGSSQRKVGPYTFLIARCSLAVMIVLNISALMMGSYRALVASLSLGIVCCGMLHSVLARIPQVSLEHEFQRQTSNLFEVEPIV